jgi:adenylosuccinate lyase
MRKGMNVLISGLGHALKEFKNFAQKDNYDSLPTVGVPGLEPPELTTVGKRATLWIQVP